MYTLLLIEDDHAIRVMLNMFLTKKAYAVLEARDGKQALSILNESTPDLIVLDWMLPDTDGLKLMAKIRQMTVHKERPIIMLTARAEEADKIKGLKTGADDYMTKPVSLEELDARIHALIRRSQGLNPHQMLTFGEITLNPQDHSVTINHENIKIAGMEYRLLYFFMKHPDRLYSRAQLLDHVWGQTTFIEERTVDVHIMRLRKILKKHQLDGLLKTIRGLGYRFSNADSNNEK